MAAPPLLLHSLAEFRDLIQSCLSAAGARVILEIGSESGANTRELLAFAAERDGQLWCIEPAPTPELERLDAEEERLHLVASRSPGALEELEACDAYIVDGDHNYWTVSRELEHIDDRARAARSPALVVLHDVSWPCGRRDHYYAPEALPAGAVHAYSWDHGSVPGRSEALRGGFRGRGEFAIALNEGGERNGVRTAVEDFVAAHDDLRFIHVPSIFGLGIVYSGEAPYAGAIEEILSPFDRNPLLERLEQNRVELYVKLIEQQDTVSELGLRNGRLLAEYDRTVTSAEAEAAALRAELAGLQERADAPGEAGS
ncbi:MAG: class I SAM-dependent methyltransferase [Actinomycetota bacterium]|nr:class I SAM-dependent methyltransferase [Actinomycetota bacterium]